jgi:hypothetical protein
MAEHPTAGALTSLEHHDFGATRHQFLGASQTGEPGTDDRYVAHLRTASVARE